MIQPKVTKIALTTEEGEARTDVRFSVSKVKRPINGQPFVDVSIVLERKLGKRWRIDDDFSINASALTDNPSESYVGDANTIISDLLTLLHGQVVGHPPYGRWLKLDAPE